MDPRAVPLRGLDRRDQVLVTADQRRVADRPVSGQRLQIRADERVDALLLIVGVEVAQPDLDVGQLGDGLLLGGVDTAPGAVVPVHPQQTAVREDRPGLVDEGLDQPLGVEVERPAVLVAGDQQTGGGVHIPGVDEDRVRGGRLGHLGEHALEKLIRALQLSADIRIVHTGFIVCAVTERAQPVAPTRGYLGSRKFSLA